jgi:ABC-type glutathione transport system ATPase component
MERRALVDRFSEVAAPAPLLLAEISADYPEKPGVLQGVSFTIHCAEILGLIGQSGSGKSTIALAVPRLLELRGGKIRGRIQFRGRDLMSCDNRALREIRGKEIALVPQSPMSALNPALRIETHLREAWRAHRSESWEFARQPTRDLLVRMGLPAADGFLRRYPRQLSVGQAQRVVIAMAVMHGPKLLIADEATSALDPVSQDEILALFRKLNVELQMAILYVSHDLPSVARLCHTVGILDAGRLVGYGPAAQLLPPGDGRSILSWGQNHEAALHVTAQDSCPNYARAPIQTPVGELDGVARYQRLKAVPGAETAAVDVHHLTGGAGGAEPFRP